MYHRSPGPSHGGTSHHAWNLGPGPGRVAIAAVRLPPCSSAESLTSRIPCATGPGSRASTTTSTLAAPSSFSTGLTNTTVGGALSAGHPPGIVVVVELVVVVVVVGGRVVLVVVVVVGRG